MQICVYPQSAVLWSLSFATWLVVIVAVVCVTLHFFASPGWWIPPSHRAPSGPGGVRDSGSTGVIRCRKTLVRCLPGCHSHSPQLTAVVCCYSSVCVCLHLGQKFAYTTSKLYPVPCTLSLSWTNTTILKLWAILNAFSRALHFSAPGNLPFVATFRWALRNWSYKTFRNWITNWKINRLTMR